MTTTASAPRTAPRPSPAPRQLPAPPRRGARTSSARRATLYVIGLLWALPLLAFTVAAARADATPCASGDGLLCNDQGTVVATGVLTTVLLIPVGLVALFVVALLGRGTKRPAVIAAVAATVGLAVGLLAVGVGFLILSD
jgi:uncharacterized membrane protein